MNTQDFVLVCLQCYPSACNYMDKLQANFDVELTEDDIRDVVQQIAPPNDPFTNNNRRPLQMGNALIVRLFDKINRRAQELYPHYAEEINDLFGYYADDYASSLTFDDVQVDNWNELAELIDCCVEGLKLPTCEVYEEYLHQACKKYNISMSEARKRYGLLNTRKWKEILEL